MKKLSSYYPIIFFVLGFIFDVATLGRLDDFWNIVTFTIYIAISLACLHIDLNKEKFSHHFFSTYSSEIFHYLQGSLLSAFTLIYFKSASLSTSFIFMFLVALFLLANEIPFVQKQKVMVKIIFFNITLMSYLLIYTPTLFGHLSFILILLALALFVVVSYFISKYYQQTLFIKSSIVCACLYLLLTLFNLTPPVPLALEFAGIYHQVEKKYPDYILHHEKPWWRFWHNGDQNFLAKPGDKIYFFTRIFAPRGFQDHVYVRFEFKTGDTWRTSDRIKLSVAGGRQQGYRGYAYKKNYPQGPGRVIVETNTRQEIGRLSFTVTKVPSS